ncbi:MAG: hypothetical protein U5L45_15080 [Saprospiraceae bacterium]|nr:hypothetical protein [Saprospiraceae bacterium]
MSVLDFPECRLMSFFNLKVPHLLRGYLCCRKNCQRAKIIKRTAEGGKQKPPKPNTSTVFVYKKRIREFVKNNLPTLPVSKSRRD